MDARIDPLSGRPTVMVESRQNRPNRPDGCPFCPGGLEAPEPYDVRWFSNRWPPMDGERCEVVLYSPRHGAALWELGIDSVTRLVTLWAERTAALASREDVEYVLVFENRGADVGATIDHPHGQIYAYDRVPPEILREMGAPRPSEDPATLVVSTRQWRGWVPVAAGWPYEMLLAPTEPIPNLHDPALDREDLAQALIDVTARLDGLFDRPMPYMMWWHQSPVPASDAPEPSAASIAHLHITPLWRAAGVARYVAAAELGGGIYFNPLPPETAAGHLRQAAPTSAELEVFAPGRVNLIGDHTDYAGGLALPMAIGMGVRFRGRRSESAMDIRSSTLDSRFAADSVAGLDPRSVEPPWARYVVAAAQVMAEHDQTSPVGLIGEFSSDLPIGVGVSSSAALCVAAILAVSPQRVAPRELAALGQAAEQRATGVPSGQMDQWASAAGRDGYAMLCDFSAERDAEGLRYAAVDGAAAFTLIHSGEERWLAESAYAERHAQVTAALADPTATASDPTLAARSRHVRSENRRVKRFADALAVGDLDTAGTLMFESHRSLSVDFEVSTPTLDAIVDALEGMAGVYGARMTGAGFGGCVIVLHRPDLDLADRAIVDFIDGDRRRQWRVEPSNGATREYRAHP